MLLESSHVGAALDLEAISCPREMDLIAWPEDISSNGFCDHGRLENASAVLEVFEKPMSLRNGLIYEADENRDTLTPSFRFSCDTAMMP